jgi:hypothetical protein
MLAIRSGTLGNTLRRREVQVKPTVPLQPPIDFGVLVSAVIVQDQMDLQPVGHFAIDGAHELDEPGVAVPGKALADHRAGQHVQGREQRRGGRCACSRGSWCPPDPQLSATTPASDPGLGSVTSHPCTTRSPCAVESAWGAVPGLLSVRFPRPLAEPGVRLSSHRALHGSCRVGVVGQDPRVGDGVAPVAVSGDRHRRQVEQLDPVHRDRCPLPRGSGEPAANVLPSPAMHPAQPPDHPPPHEVRQVTERAFAGRMFEVVGPAAHDLVEPDRTVAGSCCDVLRVMARILAFTDRIGRSAMKV